MVGDGAPSITARGNGRLPAAVAAALLVALTGCSGSSSEGSSAAPDADAFAVTSAGFVQGKPIPDRFTCDGAGRFPGIAWTGKVASTEALAVVVDDPDAPGGTYVHLVVLDLPPSTTSLEDPLTKTGTVALNSDGSAGWTPPCPPSGTHHYRFTVYALSAATGLDEQTSPDDAMSAIKAKQLGRGRLTGLVSS